MEVRVLAIALLGLATAAAGCSATRDASSAAADATVPPDLVQVAGKFGLRMLGDGFTWKPIDPKATRFEWSGRTASGDRELLYSFWRPKLEGNETKLVVQLVASAAANLAEGEPCPPLEQPKDFAQILGVDRIISVCFVPNAFYGKDFHHGILHGLVKNDALTLVAVLSNDRAAAVVPLPKSIGARGN